MKITINDNRKIHAIQEEFHEAFPYLKIQFLAKSNKTGGPASKKVIKQSSKTLGECRTIHESGNISISPYMSVADLEQAFSDVYGLGTQVFRKSGKVWLETTVTEGWTLEEQNRQGEELSSLIGIVK